MNFDHDLGLIDVVQTIDTTAVPPSGGTAGTLTINGTGALKIPTGTTAEQPANNAGWIRFNTTTGVLEANNGSTWLTSSLNDELSGLSLLTANGIVVRTADGTYASRTLTGTAGNVVVSNGDGVSGNPTINLETVTQGATGTSFVKVQLDSFGRVINNTAVTSSDITNALGSVYVPLAGGAMVSGANITFSGGGEVIGLPSVPSGSTAAVSKAYVDSVSQGLDPKGSVRAATTVAGTIASSFEAGDIIDGVTLVAGDRILIKNQGSAFENGIYTVNSSGAPTRALDMNTWAKVPNAFVFIEEGSTLADTGWLCTSNATGSPAPVIGTNDINWVQFSGVGTYTGGTGINITGNTVSLISPVTLALGGTNNASLTASNGGIVYSDATKLNVLSGTATARQMLQSGANVAPAWSTATYPATTTAGGVFYSSANNVVAELALGASNLMVIGVNHAQTNITNRTLTAGTGISITSAAETITIANTVAALQLYKENPSTPTAPSATGTNAVAIGSGSTASAVGSAAFGDGTDAKVWGGKTFANGKFATAGDAQSGLYVLRAITTNATVGVELFLDGAGAAQRLTLPNNSLMTFSIMVAARRTDATGGGAGYKFDGVIKKDGTAGSTTFVGTPSKVILGETNNKWNAYITADTTNGSLTIAVTGETSKTIRWVATVRTSEVTN